MPFGRLNAYASYTDIESKKRERKHIILVLGLVIGLVMVKFLTFLGVGISPAY